MSVENATVRLFEIAIPFLFVCTGYWLQELTDSTRNYFRSISSPILRGFVRLQNEVLMLSASLILIIGVRIFEDKGLYTGLLVVITLVILLILMGIIAGVLRKPNVKKLMTVHLVLFIVSTLSVWTFVYVFFYMEWSQHFGKEKNYTIWKCWFNWIASLFAAGLSIYLGFSYYRWRRREFSLVPKSGSTENAFKENLRFLWHPTAEVSTDAVQPWLEELYIAMAYQVSAIRAKNPSFLEEYKEELGFHYCGIKTKLQNIR